MHRSILLSACLLAPPALAVTLAPLPAAADAKGDEILAKLDRDAERFSDQAYVATMKIHRGGSVKKTYGFEMTM